MSNHLSCESKQIDPSSFENISNAVVDKMAVNVNSVILRPKILPPSWNHVTDTALSHGLNLANNQEAFCSNPDDLPDKPR